MRVFYFTEQPYPDAWDEPFLRVDIPNALCDPDVAHKLFRRYHDEYVYASECGLNMMVNEHHATSTCLSASATVTLSILARETTQGRILTLGMPIANRQDPLRVAEELAMIDVISNGRLEMGFVKGAPYEVPIANTSPLGMMDRLWEGHDLIVKAMTTTDGPFSWQGEHYQYHTVNIWPRPKQKLPPVWITALSLGSAPAIAERGHILATVLGGMKNTRALFDAYRKTSDQLGKPVVAADRFAYAALLGIASTEAEAKRRGAIVRTYLDGSRVAKQYSSVSGYFSVDAVAGMMRAPASSQKVEGFSGTKFIMGTADVDGLTDAGVMFCGTPDQVFDQIVKFDEAVGGLGNLIIMAQAGQLNHADTCDSIRLFAEEVLPRLKDRFGTRDEFLQAA
jgi:alkanesulfonate monooxygenase SsuD/methylene tetrahydromethanopterin reductase-like flavin-dependent oxidoreductase (luciferase family)